MQVCVGGACFFVQVQMAQCSSHALCMPHFPETAEPWPPWRSAQMQVRRADWRALVGMCVRARACKFASVGVCVCACMCFCACVWEVFTRLF